MMGVDEPRRNDFICAVNDLTAFGGGDGLFDSRDAIAFNQDVGLGRNDVVVSIMAQHHAGFEEYRHLREDVARACRK